MTTIGNDPDRFPAPSQSGRLVASSRSRIVHFYGLDALRLAAASLVVLDHFSLFGWRVATARAVGQDVAFPQLHRMSNIGSTGVEIFFLISGFVISQSTLRESAPRFAIKRAIRLLPALWMCGALALVARVTLGEPPFALILAFLRSAVLSPAGPYIDGVVWTLVVEAVFYACVCACLALPTRLSLQGLAYAVGSASAVFVFIMFLADQHALGAALSPRALAIMDRFPFKVALLREGVFFSAGILIWLQIRLGADPGRRVMLGVVLVACTLELTIMRARGFEVVAAVLVWWSSLLMLLLSVRYSSQIAHRLGAVRPAILAAGNFSYPLYLSHYTVGYVVVYQLSRTGLPRSATAALSIAVVLILSALVAFGLEPRVQALLRARWLTQKPSLTVASGRDLDAASVQP